VGHRTRVRITKNKVAPPFRVAEFDIMFGSGISRAGDLLDIGLELGILDKRGSYYYYEGERFAQGRENAKLYVGENPTFADDIERLIRERLQTLEEVPLKVGVTAEGGEMDVEDI